MTKWWLEEHPKIEDEMREENLCQATASTSGDAVSREDALQSGEGADTRNEFNPDWELNATESLAVALTISLAKHIPNWPGATDEQLAAVAVDIGTDEVHDLRDRLSLRKELKDLTRLNRLCSAELKVSAEAVDSISTEIARVHSVLLERMKLKYAGDCKCGNCHLVPVDVIMNAANLISYSLPQRPIEEAGLPANTAVHLASGQPDTKI